jgi:hypothetical protein
VSHPTAIKAIETWYAGHRFRSRLEARWAVFFDQLGIPWQYEPQGFSVNGQAYLPDFYLPSDRTYVEVKGDPRQLDMGLLTAFAEHHPLLLLGPIPDPPAEHQGDLGWLDLSQGYRVGFGNHQYKGRLWFHFNADVDLEHPLQPTVDEYERGVPRAYIAARSARFEHGEKP